MKKELNTDRELIKRFEENTEEGFRLIVIKYREKLYFHIRRILILHEDSDDALQNTFIKAWQGLNGFRKESSLYTWLFRIATNEALQVLRKRKEEKSMDSETLEIIFSGSHEADIYFDGDDAYRKLTEAILTLPEKQQLVFNMKYFDDMKYEDMSEILSTSVGALKASFHHARKKIEDLLGED